MEKERAEMASIDLAGEVFTRLHVTLIEDYLHRLDDIADRLHRLDHDIEDLENRIIIHKVISEIGVN